MLITYKLLSSDEMDESGVFDDSLHYFQNGLNVANEITIQNNSFGNNTIQNRTNERETNVKKTLETEKPCVDDPCLKDEHSAIENLKHLLRLGNFEHMYGILQNIRSSSENRDEFLRLWDESHYQEYKQKMNRSGKLSSIQKYRIRLRNPPPLGICPDGVRPRTRLSRSSLKVLRDWYKLHAMRPYPCRITKEALSKRTGIALNKVSCWFSNARRKHRSHGFEAVVGKTYSTQNTQTTSTATSGSPNKASTSTVFSMSEATKRQMVELSRPLPEANYSNQAEVSAIEATARTHEKYSSNNMFSTRNELLGNVMNEPEKIVDDSDTTSIALIVEDQNMETEPEVNDYYYVLQDLANQPYFQVVDLRSVYPLVQVVQELHDYCPTTERTTSDYSTQINVDILSENSDPRNTQQHASASIENDVIIQSTLNDTRTSPKSHLSMFPATDNVNKCFDVSIDLTNKQLTDALKTLYNLQEISNDNEALGSKQCKIDIPKISTAVKPRTQDYNHRIGPGYDTDVLPRNDTISQSQGPINSSVIPPTSTRHTSNDMEMTTACSYENGVEAFDQTEETNKKLEKTSKDNYLLTLDRPLGKMQGVHSKTKVNKTVSALKLRLKLQGRREGNQRHDRDPNHTEPDTESIDVTKCLESLRQLCEKVTKTVQSPEDYALCVDFNENDSDSEREHNVDHIEDVAAKVIPVWDNRSWKKRKLEPENRKEENRVARNNDDYRLCCRCAGKIVPSDVENMRKRASKNTERSFGLDLIQATQSQRHNMGSHGLIGSYHSCLLPDALSSPVFTLKPEMESDYMNNSPYSYSRALDWRFDTVVGEAVQGLLNLTSSQESSSSSLQ